MEDSRIRGNRIGTPIRHLMDLCRAGAARRRTLCRAWCPRAGLSLLHVACTARIACKWVRESRLCSQNTTLPPYARRVRKPSPLIVRQGSRRLASRNVSRRPSEVEPSPERVRWPRMSLFPHNATPRGQRSARTRPRLSQMKRVLLRVRLLRRHDAPPTCAVDIDVDRSR